MKRIAIIAIVLLGALMLPVQPVSAHVFISDSIGTKGAILHINPDDDPIAGQSSTLFLDTQISLRRAVLTITAQTGTVTTIDATITGSLATFTYTFPTQGAYTLNFETTTDTTHDTFSYTQRVSRGSATTTLIKPVHTWAELLLISSCIGLGVLAIIAFNHRKAIAKHSTF